jgi:hypothetical protein
MSCVDAFSSRGRQAPGRQTIGAPDRVPCERSVRDLFATLGFHPRNVVKSSLGAKSRKRMPFLLKFIG